MEASDPLFDVLYPFVAHDLWKGRLPVDLGSLESKQQALQELRRMLKAGKGEVVRLNRWFQVWTRVREFLPHWSGHLVLNLVQCLQRGYYQHFSELRLFQPPPEEPEGVGAAPTAGIVRPQAKAAPRPVKSSNANVELLRAKCENTMHLATEILCSRSSRAALVGLTGIIQAVEIQHSLDVTRLKTRRGRRDWNVEAAAGESSQYLLGTWLALRSTDLLIDMGCEPFHEAYTQTLLEPRMSLQVLQRLYHFWRVLVAKELSFLRHWQMHMPGLAFTQLHRDESVRTRGLETMRLLWQRLEVYEAAAQENRTLAEQLRDMEWTRTGNRSGTSPDSPGLAVSRAGPGRDGGEGETRCSEDGLGSGGAVGCGLRQVGRGGLVWARVGGGGRWPVLGGLRGLLRGRLGRCGCVVWLAVVSQEARWGAWGRGWVLGAARGPATRSGGARVRAEMVPGPASRGVCGAGSCCWPGRSASGHACPRSSCRRLRPRRQW